MACRGLEIFWPRGSRGSPIRSMRWLPVFAMTVIISSLPASSVSQVCPNGTYLHTDPAPHSTAPPPPQEAGLTGVTTSSWTVTSHGPDCRNCNESIAECVLCESQNNSVFCQECISGYEPTNSEENCTAAKSSTPSGSNDTTKIIIGVVVGVGGLLIVVAIIIGIIFGVRKGAFDKCHCPCDESDSAPPPLPPPEELGLSFNSKKSNPQSGTGQPVDLRYTQEPGGTARRVESVHYDGYKGKQEDDSVYMNSPNCNIPEPVQEDHEDEYANTDDPDDELYINAGSSPPVNQSSRDKPKKTKAAPVQQSSKPGPPKPKPKPKTSEKPTSETKPQTHFGTPGNRESIFPPAESEDVYSNEPETEDDEEDYVNKESYQPNKP